MWDCVITIYDNVTKHTVRQPKQWFQQYGWEVLQPQVLTWNPQTFISSMAFISAAICDHHTAAVMTRLQALDQDVFANGFIALSFLLRQVPQKGW
jgi:hypothetical protein